jgi:agmatinase
MMTEALQFLGPEPQYTEFKSARAVVLPLPLEKSTSYMKGTANGPKAIVEASHQVEMFDPELVGDASLLGIHTDWELGDPAWNNEPVEKLLDRIRLKTRSLLEQNKFVLALGGEHTITVGLIDPYLERYPGKLTVVQLDAHSDLKDSYHDTPYSHACVMRRLLGRVPILAAGIRSVDPEEYELGSKGEGIRTFYAHEIHRNPNWISELIHSIQTPYVYLTVDVDGLDPSVIPSTGTPEPGGIGWWDAMSLIRGITERHTIVGADVNEFSPDQTRYASFAAAKLCYKILCYSLLPPRRSST